MAPGLPGSTNWISVDSVNFLERLEWRGSNLEVLKGYESGGLQHDKLPQLGWSDGEGYYSGSMPSWGVYAHQGKIT